jgi:hypothetical protein
LITPKGMIIYVTGAATAREKEGGDPGGRVHGPLTRTTDGCLARFSRFINR